VADGPPTKELNVLSLQEISDRMEIQDVLAKYSDAIDSRRWDDLDALFRLHRARWADVETAFAGRDEAFSGKYQQGTDIDTIIKTWSPDMMLPKAYRDQRSLPTKIDGLSYD